MTQQSMTSLRNSCLEIVKDVCDRWKDQPADRSTWDEYQDLCEFLNDVDVLEREMHGVFIRVSNILNVLEASFSCKGCSEGTVDSPICLLCSKGKLNAI